jgi:hypothetical protein
VKNYFSTHGHAKGGVVSPEYEAWRAMKKRCSLPSRHDFANYGGRGITVCAEWLASFANFIRDMGPKPEGLTLDRVDTNGNYEPGNCRWATRSVQQLNRRKFSGRSQYRGVQRNGIYWIVRPTIDGVKRFVGNFHSEIEAAQARDRFLIENGIDQALNFPELASSIVAEITERRRAQDNPGVASLDAARAKKNGDR